MRRAAALAVAALCAAGATLAVAQQVRSGRDRQLFVDDKVIDELTGVQLTLHQPTNYAGNPVILQDQPWEAGSIAIYGTVLYDEQDQIFKAWYRALGDTVYACYAISTNGLHWTKPALHIKPFNGSTANNIVLGGPGFYLDGFGVLKDLNDPDPSRRYKMLTYSSINGIGDGAAAMVSPDGLHWSGPVNSPLIPTGDVISVYYDTGLRQYVGLLKQYINGKRSRLTSRSTDFVRWSTPVPVMIPDALDPPTVHLYSHVAYMYEGMRIGYVSVFDKATELIDTQLCSSCDGLTWDRYRQRIPFLPNGPSGAFDSGMLIAGGSGSIIRDGLIWIYYGGYNVDHEGRPTDGVGPGRGDIGVAFLRQDGFVSADAGPAGGTLLTKPLVCPGMSLRINASAPAGEIRAELLDAGGTPVPGYDLASAIPFTGDSLDAPLGWTQPIPPSLVGQAIRIRFHLTDASLYAFRFDGAASAPVILYRHDFADLADITTEGGVTVLAGPAHGGKPGNALTISNPGMGDAWVTLTPSGVGTLPSSLTVAFRYYVRGQTNFLGAYNYAPGEGIRFLSGGALQGSCGEPLTGTWTTGAWYTVALVLVDGGTLRAYIKPGADAQLTEADYVGSICGAARPMTRTVFFDYGGDVSIADYVINAGHDLRITPRPANDDCANAQPVAEGPVSGTTLGASNDGSASCGSSDSAPDVWYTYTAACDGYLSVAAVGTTFDMVISVHAGETGCPGSAPDELACDAACGAVRSCGSAQCLRVPVEAGRRYRIRVAGIDGAAGDFQLQLACEPRWTLYCHRFNDLHDITAYGAVRLAVVAAPGGKAGTALRVSNIDNAASSWAQLTPSNVGTLPNSLTVVCRFYIDAHAKFQGVYTYAPGEGLVVRDDGAFGHSWGGSFGVPWREDMWYTVAEHLVEGGNMDVYLKEGADARLSSADYIGSVAGPGRPMTHSIFFNYGGELYVADYAINAGFDLGPCPEPICSTPPADADGDGDTDLADFHAFQACFNGPNRPWPAEADDARCACLDTDHDRDVDLADFGVFHACFNGPNRPPACP